MKVISKKIELKKIQKQKIRKVAKFPNSHIFFKAMVCLYNNQFLGVFCVPKLKSYRHGEKNN